MRSTCTTLVLLAGLAPFVVAPFAVAVAAVEGGAAGVVTEGAEEQRALLPRLYLELAGRSEEHAGVTASGQGRLFLPSLRDNSSSLSVTWRRASSRSTNAGLGLSLYPLSSDAVGVARLHPLDWARRPFLSQRQRDQTFVSTGAVEPAVVVPALVAHGDVGPVRA